MKNKKLLLVYRGRFASCPRPKRLYLHLCDENQIDICSLDTNSIEGLTSYPIIKKTISPFVHKVKTLCIKYRIPWAAKYCAGLDCDIEITDEQLRQYDWIFVHDLALLPFFVDYADKVIFDAREYYPRQFIADNPKHQLILDAYDYYCGALLHKFPRKITVSQGIADEYKQHYGADFAIFKSFPVQQTTPCSQKVTLDPSKVNLIHHGGCMPNRSMEKLIEFGARLGEGFHLYLMLVWLDEKYYKSIVKLASKHENVTIIAPVDFQQIIPFISQFDIGIHFLEDLDGQHAVSLPNKFFEFVAAGLMLLVSGSDEMIVETEKHQLGLAYRGVSNLDKLQDDVKALSKEQIQEFKKNSLRAAPSFDFGTQFEQLEKQLKL